MNYQAMNERAAAIADHLERIASLLNEELSLAEEARKLRSRANQIRDGRFQILVVGEFKRGKSTLLNSMLGNNILPQRAAPCTAVITRIRYADQSGVRIVFDNDTPPRDLTLEEFRREYELNIADATDAPQPKDRFSHVSHAVISYPIDLCRHGVELVDTPGLGEHLSRTQRTTDYLIHADAVVFLLDASQFLGMQENDFLQSILLPMGLTNIFFVVNKWNLLEDSMVNPEDAERDRAAINERIRRMLHPFCVVNGTDHSASRIFRVNALGALQARMKQAETSALEQSGVPAFEKSLERFLVEDRFQARAEVLQTALQALSDDVGRSIGGRISLSQKQIAEVVQTQRALQPKLERLRGIRQHIISYLQTQSGLLQDRLKFSLNEHVDNLIAELPEKVSQFDLSAITNRWMAWMAITDLLRKEREFTALLDQHLHPQVQKLLESSFATWQLSVRQNLLPAVMTDVEQHLQEEAAEYQRVMGEIEQMIGSESNPLEIRDLVNRWINGDGQSGVQVNLSVAAGVNEAFGVLLGGLASEVLMQGFLNLATGGATLVASVVLTVIRLGYNQMSASDRLQAQVVEGIAKGLRVDVAPKALTLAHGIQGAFKELESKIAGSIDDQIEVVDATLATTLKQKEDATYQADSIRRHLEGIQKEFLASVGSINSLLARISPAHPTDA